MERERIDIVIECFALNEVERQREMDGLNKLVHAKMRGGRGREGER